MLHKNRFMWMALALSTNLAVPAALAQVTIPTELVENPRNSADPTTGYGAVDYKYRIGKFEVTNVQYVYFLNAVARDDVNGLFNAGMSQSIGGIVRFGSPGTYRYWAWPGRENHPVNFVSFWDACRYANWLHNGQPVGSQGPSTTEDGAYSLSDTGMATNTIERNSAWRWAITSENEWYKAAYHQPSAEGGDHDDYWLFPTGGNTAQTSQANFMFAVGDTTPVGAYMPNYYDTFDMGGNVWEWSEANNPTGYCCRDTRLVLGGSYGDNDPTALQAGYRGSHYSPRTEAGYIGFRLVERVFCASDFNRSGFTDSDDFLEYLMHFSLGCVAAGESIFGNEAACATSADFDNSGFVDSDDFIAYIEAFESPC